MSNSVANQFETTLVRAPRVMRRWWIFAFIVSLIVFSSALLFLSAEAYAKPKGGGSGGSDPVGGSLPSVGPSGGGSDGGGGGGGYKTASLGEVNGPRGDNFSGDIGGGREGGAGSGGDSRIGGGTLDSGAPEQQVQQAAKQLDQQTAELTLHQVKGEMADPQQFAEPALNTVKQTANDTQNQVSEITQPVLNSAEQALAPAKQLVEQALVPPTQQVIEPPTQQQVLAPAQQALDEVSSPDKQATVSVLGEAASLPEVALILEGQLALPQSADILASQLAATPSPVLEAVKSISVDSSGSPAAPPATLSDFEGSSAQLLVQRKQVSAAAPLISISGEHPMVFNLVRADSVARQVPQPFSLGAMLAAGSSLSGSSSSSSGGSGGFDVDALVLLSILLISGKFLWSAQNFLKPSTALMPIIECPG